MQVRFYPYMQGHLHASIKRVEEKLDAIERNTKTTWRELLLGGFLRGAGIILGSAVTLALAGWSLAVLNLLPGAEDIASFLADTIEQSTD